MKADNSKKLGTSIRRRVDYSASLYSVRCDCERCFNGGCINVRISRVWKFARKRVYYCKRCLRECAAVYTPDAHSEKCTKHGENVIVYFFTVLYCTLYNNVK